MQKYKIQHKNKKKKIVRICKSESFDSFESLQKATDKLPGNCEGFVVSFTNGFRFKLKGQEYLKLQQLRKGYNESKIEELLLNGVHIASLEQVLSVVNEEFHKITTLWYNHYKSQLMNIGEQTVEQSMQILKLGLTKKEIASLKKSGFKHERITMKIDFPCEMMIFGTHKLLEEHSDGNVLKRLQDLAKHEVENQDMCNMSQWATNEHNVIKKELMKILFFENPKWRQSIWNQAKKRKLVQRYDESQKRS